jgi:hypothetical protein
LHENFQFLKKLCLFDFLVFLALFPLGKSVTDLTLFV